MFRFNSSNSKIQVYISVVEALFRRDDHALGMESEKFELLNLWSPVRLLGGNVAYVRWLIFSMLAPNQQIPVNRISSTAENSKINSNWRWIAFVCSFVQNLPLFFFSKISSLVFIISFQLRRFFLVNLSLAWNRYRMPAI